MEIRWIVLFMLFFNQGASAKDIKVAIGLDRPPYVIEEANTGYELELIRGIMAIAQCDATFVHMPRGRYNRLLQNEFVDAVASLDRRVQSAEVFYSLPYITYQNVAISLARKNLNIKQFSDMEGLVVAGFQQATNMLGEGFESGVSAARRYFELADQHQQVNMLLEGKVDVLIIDINIFRYIAHMEDNSEKLDDIDIHYLFESSPLKVGFHRQKLRDEFNQALNQYVLSQEFEKLKEKYKIMVLD